MPHKSIKGKKMKVLIIGNHAAGLTAAEVLRKNSDKTDITIISKENTPPYSRCLVSDIISGEKNIEDILFKDKDFYEKNRINAMLGKTALSVDAENKTVILDDKSKIPYDNLIIATGGDPAMPDLPGINLKGVFGLRTDQDALKIKDYLKNSKTAVVLGGGLVGIKAAAALSLTGKKVKVFVASSGILSQILSKDEADILQNKLEDQGVEFLMHSDGKEIMGKQKAECLITDKGDKIECELIIVAKGVKANTGLIKDTSIKTDHGIIINDSCMTNIKTIYAAGDVAQSKDDIRNESWMNSIWPLAVEEGKVAALNISGKKTNLLERTSMNAFHIAGTWLVSCGLTGLRDTKEDTEKYFLLDRKKNNYKKFIFKDNQLVGFALIGNILNAGVLNLLMRKKINLGNTKDQLLAGKYDFSSMIPCIMENKERFNEPEFREVLDSFK